VKILIDITHPADVHQFKNAILILKANGHKILVTARNKDVTLDLLDKFGMGYVEVGRYKKNNVSKAVEMFRINYKLYKLAKRFNPDVLIGSVGNVYVAHVSALINKPSILFSDTEHGTLQNLLSYPFASAICTPSCYTKDLGKKQIRYNGYHELAYLHPNYFTPNPAVLDEMGLSKDDIFIILRFVSWDASPDVGQHGIKNKIELVRELEKYSRVFITSEGRLDEELEKYKIKVSPEKLHDLLYYTGLYVGEGATMASEAAVLGTHAVYVNTLRLGYTDEEEEKYDLVYNFSDEKTMEKEAFDKALELLENNNLRKDGKRKREKLLKDKIDVTAFMVWFIENYPESFKEMKENPWVQERFRRGDENVS
jgi:predicted glycosyltransferase